MLNSRKMPPNPAADAAIEVLAKDLPEEAASLPSDLVETLWEALVQAINVVAGDGFNMPENPDPGTVNPVAWAVLRAFERAIAGSKLPALTAYKFDARAAVSSPDGAMKAAETFRKLAADRAVAAEIDKQTEQLRTAQASAEQPQKEAPDARAAINAARGETNAG